MSKKGMRKKAKQRHHWDGKNELDYGNYIQWYMNRHTTKRKHKNYEIETEINQSYE